MFLRYLDLDAVVRDLNIMFNDSVDRCHGLFVSSVQILGILSKESTYDELDD